MSDTPVLGDFSQTRIFLPLIMKYVFQKFALYRKRGANTLLVSDWLNVFLKNCDIILKIPEGCWKSMALLRYLNVCYNKRGSRMR